MKSFVLINAKIVTHQEIFEGYVVVSDGKIKEVGRGQKYDGSFETIDLKGKYILPGLIDVHVHFRTPGMTEKEDWVTGSKAALAGGVTTVLDMPNTIPATINAEILEQKRAIVQPQSLVNYGFYLGATHGNVSELAKAKNIAGVKIYMGSSTGSLLVDNKEKLEEFFAEAAPNKSNKLLAIHAETESCIREGMEKFKDSDDARKHSLIRAPECAYDAVKEALHLAKKYGTRTHICHLSTAKELEVVKKFKSVLISVEVTPHHLFLNDQDYETYGNLVKVNPPLRSMQDQVALWGGIKNGLVEMVSTDHAPHLLEEKRLPYGQAPSGLPGVQTMLPLLLNAVNEEKLTLQKVVELCAYNPARKFKIAGKGEIIEGADADLTIVDMDFTEKVCHKFLWTKPDWSPFHGWVLKGWPVMTFVGGELMYEWRDKFGKMPGKEVTFN